MLCTTDNICPPKKKILNFDELAFWTFAAAVSFTAFGPVIHYVLGPLALIFLLISKLRKEKVFYAPVHRDAKVIIFLFILFTLWSMFPHALYVDNFHDWGKGASVTFEALVFLLMGLRIFNTEKRCDKFAVMFVFANGIFCLDLILRIIFPSIAVNDGLTQSNAYGTYAVLVLPLLVCYALWRKSVILKLYLPLVGILTLFLSFSSGAYSAALPMAIIGIYFAVKAKVLKIDTIIYTVLFVLVAVMTVNYFTNDLVETSFKREIDQITSVNDTDKLTTIRTHVWRATWHMSKEHPIVGHGIAGFAEQYKNNLDIFVEKFGVRKDFLFDDVHNMYLSAIYAAGFPAFILLTVVLILLLYRTFKYSRVECSNSDIFPWSLIALLLVVGQIIQGFSGDIFEARRDIGVIFWAIMGLSLAIPFMKNNADQKNEE